MNDGFEHRWMFELGRGIRKLWVRAAADEIGDGVFYEQGQAQARAMRPVVVHSIRFVRGRRDANKNKTWWPLVYDAVVCFEGRGRNGKKTHIAFLPEMSPHVVPGDEEDAGLRWWGIIQRDNMYESWSGNDGMRWLNKDTVVHIDPTKWQLGRRVGKHVIWLDTIVDSNEKPSDPNMTARNVTWAPNVASDLPPPPPVSSSRRRRSSLQLESANVPGDGNCLYSSLLFAYFNRVPTNDDIQEFRNLLANAIPDYVNAAENKETEETILDQLATLDASKRHVRGPYGARKKEIIAAAKEYVGRMGNWGDTTMIDIFEFMNGQRVRVGIVIVVDPDDPNARFKEYANQLGTIRNGNFINQLPDTSRELIVLQLSNGNHFTPLGLNGVYKFSNKAMIEAIVNAYATRAPPRQDPFRQDPFRQDPFRQDPFRQDPFRQDPFKAAAPPRQDPFRQDPFRAAAAPVVWCPPCPPCSRKHHDDDDDDDGLRHWW